MLQAYEVLGREVHPVLAARLNKLGVFPRRGGNYGLGDARNFVFEALPKAPSKDYRTRASCSER